MNEVDGLRGQELIAPTSDSNALVLQGGGLSGVYQMGVLAAMEHSGIEPTTFTELRSESAGSANGSAYLSGKAVKAAWHYVDNLTSKDVVDLSMLLRGGKVANLERVTELAQENNLTDEAAILRMSTKFRIGVTNAITGAAEFVTPGEEGELDKMLLASAAIPTRFAYGETVEIDGVHYADGSLSHAVPHEVGAREASKTVILNQSLQESVQAGRVVRAVEARAARLGQAISGVAPIVGVALGYPARLRTNLGNIYAEVGDPNVNVTVVSPSNPERQVKPWTTDKDLMIDAARMGYEDAAEVFADVNPDRNPFS